MKKWLLAAASLLMVVSLAGCGSKTIASLKGGKITQDEYYKEIKETSAGKQQLQQMILQKALENQYGSKAIDKKKLRKLMMVTKKTIRFIIQLCACTKQYDTYII